jgi:septal ring factor EnvC (AmiA/AmiB activator)
MNVAATVEDKIQALRDDVSEQFGEVRKELKELTQALRDLIRLDGDIRRLQDAVSRIGRSCDDHELRLRVLEEAKTATTVRTGYLDRRQWLVTTTAAVLFSGTATGLLVFYLTH